MLVAGDLECVRCLPEMRYFFFESLAHGNGLMALRAGNLGYLLLRLGLLRERLLETVNADVIAARKHQNCSIISLFR